jgi:hypothetical protein
MLAGLGLERIEVIDVGRSGGAVPLAVLGWVGPGRGR